MKKLVAIFALLSVFGATQASSFEYSSQEEAPEQAEVERAAINTIQVTGSDGETSTMVLYDDGTFTIGEVTGTYHQSDEKTCYLSDADGAEESCWSQAVANEDGVMTSTSDNGDVVTISASQD